MQDTWRGISISTGSSCVLMSDKVLREELAVSRYHSRSRSQADPVAAYCRILRPLLGLFYASHADHSDLSCMYDDGVDGDHGGGFSQR